MSGIDWKEKGRAVVAEAVSLTAQETGITQTEVARLIIAKGQDQTAALRHRFADLLAAVRWGATFCWQPAGMASIRSADGAEAEALRLLVEGFRERLKELAGSTTERIE